MIHRVILDQKEQSSSTRDIKGQSYINMANAQEKSRVSAQVSMGES